MKTYSSILAWRIPWTEEPGGLQFIGLQRDITEATYLVCTGDVEVMEEYSKETILQPWGRGLVPHRAIRITRSLSSFEGSENPLTWEKLMVWCTQASSLQTGTRTLMMLTLTYLSTIQSQECIALFEPLLLNFSLAPPGWDTHF